MTREEAKEIFLNHGFIKVEGCRGRIFNGDKWREACMIISEWLKEEPVLDKIRAEIEPTRKMYLEMNDIDWLNGCDYVLSVIDKYKAESEE